jgi:bleomycin hydrolase
MYKNIRIIGLLTLTLSFGVINNLTAQDANGKGGPYTVVQNPTVRKNKKNGGFTFTTVKEVGSTSVKNQYHSGTCWTYSSQSFLESELIRAGKGAYDLSEMFIVRTSYSLKAQKYLRYQGTSNFGPGGEFHDMVYIMKNFGVVPQEAFSGFPNGGSKPQHNEMDAVVKSMIDAGLKSMDGGLTGSLMPAVESTLDAYLGKVPSKFNYKGKEYTPKSFQESLGINPDDYIEIGSYTHHPFYQSFNLEVSDNWANSMVYNVPLEEMNKIAENAINNNYSIAWAADVSEKGFSFKNGVAIVPEKPWVDMTKMEADSAFTKPQPEMNITQEMRQTAFDRLSTTDDHGMHIIGMAKDQAGTPYYIVKNSWGTEGNDCDGYFYCSVPYFKYKTTSILVNKKAIPKDIAKKMGLSI